MRLSRAAKLASVPIEAPAHALGSTTEEALQSGLVIGAAANGKSLSAAARRSIRTKALILCAGSEDEAALKTKKAVREDCGPLPSGARRT